MCLKYQEELNTYVTEANCDESYSPTNITAFRWTFEEITDVKNFQPIGIRNPKRTSKCGYWALSFYQSLQESIASWTFLNKDKPNMFKKLGTHVATGEITQEDGLCSEINEFGHFDCFEFEETNFEPKFTIIKSLHNGE